MTFWRLLFSPYRGAPSQDDDIQQAAILVGVSLLVEFILLTRRLPESSLWS